MPCGTSAAFSPKEVRVTQVKVLKVQIHIVLKGNSPSNVSRRRKSCPPNNGLQGSAVNDGYSDQLYRWVENSYRLISTHILCAHPSPGLTKAKKHPHKHAEAAGKKTAGAAESDERRSEFPIPENYKE